MNDKCHAADVPEEESGCVNGRELPPSALPRSLVSQRPQAMSSEDRLVMLTELMNQGMDLQRQIVMLLTQVVAQNSDLIAMLMDDEQDDEKRDPISEKPGRVMAHRG